MFYVNNGECFPSKHPLNEPIQASKLVTTLIWEHMHEVHVPQFFEHMDMLLCTQCMYVCGFVMA